MIPKTVHYCWFGGSPLPELAEKCISSWRKYLPGFEIKEWNESNYDISACPLYVRQAYEAKKWAFVSDYARFDILYRYGGVYFDTDVEVIKPMDDIISAGAFMGCETPPSSKKELTVAPGLGIACESDSPLYKEILDYYSGLSFINPDGSYNTATVVTHITGILKKHGLENVPGIQKVENINIYPADYFCPVNELGEKNNFTENTRSIHWYSASGYSQEQKEKRLRIKRANRRDKIIHAPNRVLIKLLGEEKYNIIKKKLKH